MTHRETQEAARIEELEEAVRNILDVVTGWTRSMTEGEKFRAIQKISYDALGIMEDERMTQLYEPREVVHELPQAARQQRWFAKTLLRRKLFGREWLLEIRWRNV